MSDTQLISQIQSPWRDSGRGGGGEGGGPEGRREEITERGRRERKRENGKVLAGIRDGGGRGG